MTHPDGLNVYPIGASGLWPRVVVPGSANSSITTSNVNTFEDESPKLSPIPPTDEDFKDALFIFAINCGCQVFPFWTRLK